jgi:nitrite reductase (NADH) small subunit
MSPEPGGWVSVARLADLEPRGRTLVRVNDMEIALFRVGDRVYAIDNRCPHRSGPLIRGFLEDGPSIRCPMHGWRYDLATGACDRPAQATVFPVRLENDEIAVQV